MVCFRWGIQMSTVDLSQRYFVKSEANGRFRKIYGMHFRLLGGCGLLVVSSFDCRIGLLESSPQYSLFPQKTTRCLSRRCR
ncbi:uncharacterized protein ARMOST_13028 [Armillaria ostoyae]|uniref:Uncharacterized protein n=1 Tax=Armillaria ostoyae TaxID=47428 RepID=A0A284RLK7_ARMOS|nr:uncharacterized protein ARMOST_13028 [Armillaria ostoyae]